MKSIKCSFNSALLVGISLAGAFIVLTGVALPVRTAYASGVAQQNLRGQSELPWLFAVFVITWAAFFAYVFIISRRQREMRNEIQALKRALADRVSKS